MPVFKAAYRQLCTRIWGELETLLARLDRPDLDTRMAMLRLEIVVLLDSCRSPGWRGMLSAEQSDGLCSMLTDVLAALCVDPEQLRAGIEAAQDRVLHELPAEEEVVCENDPPALSATA